jgi:hypothetical protein
MRLDLTLKKSSPIYLGPKNLDTILMHWMSVKLADNFQIRQNDFYYTRVPGFSCIGRTREGLRFSITFVLYVKKIFISRVCKCVTQSVYNVQK